MTTPSQRIHLVVEGPGDKDAVQLLVRRILQAHNLHHVQLTTPQVRGGLSAVRKRFTDYWPYALMNECPILWVLDCEDDCGVNEARTFEQTMHKLARHDAQPTKFAFFHREMETLFLAEEEALRNFYALKPDVQIPPEAISRRNAKGEISKLLPANRAYKETTDQAKIAARLDLARCRKISRDFRHLEKAILDLMNGQKFIL